MDHVQNHAKEELCLEQKFILVQIMYSARVPLVVEMVHTCIGRSGHLAHNLATVEREVVRELTLVCLVLMYKLKLVEVSVVILIGK